MYKHLVVAVDGSETSVNALRHACSVAAAGKAKLTLVHVANPAEYMASYEEAAIANGNEVLSEAVEITNDAEPGISGVNTHLLLANKGAREMAQELVDYASQQGADLLVLGTHGRTGLMHLLMGSFAETVMRQSHLPLLIIRSEQPDEA